MREHGMFVVLAIVIGATVWFNRPAPTLPDGSVPVETSHDFHAIRRGVEVDGVVEVRDAAGAVGGRYLLRDGQLYRPPGSSGDVGVRLVRHHYLVDPGFDAGAWVGYGLADFDGGIDRDQIGLRASPVRLLYGTVAFDVVAAHDVAGIGVSIYPPSIFFGRAWRSLGIGTWYVSPYHDGDPGWVLGASFSTRH